jgi:hypothetical protein
MRVEGATPPVILISAKATLAALTACLCLTVTAESEAMALQPVRAEEQPSRLRQDHRARHMAPCAAPLRSAQTGTSPAASRAVCSTHSRRRRRNPLPP